MADERLEAGAESCRARRLRRLPPGCRLENRRAILEDRQRGNDADASLLHCLRQPDVDDRDHPPLEERRVGTFGSGQPERLEVRDRNPSDPGRYPVGDARREM